MYKVEISKEGFGRIDNTRRPVLVEEKQFDSFEQAKDYAKEAEEKYSLELKNGNYELTTFDIEVTSDLELGIVYRILVKLANGVITTTEFTKREGDFSERQLDLGANFEEKTIRRETKDSRKIKKYNVGDSVKFKDGRTGVVEDYDSFCYLIKDNNGNICRVKKEIKDSLLKLSGIKIGKFTNDGFVNLATKEGQYKLNLVMFTAKLKQYLSKKGFKLSGNGSSYQDGTVFEVKTPSETNGTMYMFVKMMDYQGMEVFYFQPIFYDENDTNIWPDNGAIGINVNASEEEITSDFNEASDFIENNFNELNKKNLTEDSKPIKDSNVSINYDGKNWVVSDNVNGTVYEFATMDDAVEKVETLMSEIENSNEYAHKNLELLNKKNSENYTGAYGTFDSKKVKDTINFSSKVEIEARDLSREELVKLDQALEEWTEKHHTVGGFGVFYVYNSSIEEVKEYLLSKGIKL